MTQVPHAGLYNKERARVRAREGAFSRVQEKGPLGSRPRPPKVKRQKKSRVKTQRPSGQDPGAFGSRPKWPRVKRQLARVKKRSWEGAHRLQKAQETGIRRRVGTFWDRRYLLVRRGVGSPGESMRNSSRYHSCRHSADSRGSMSSGIESGARGSSGSPVTAR